MTRGQLCLMTVVIFASSLIVAAATFLALDGLVLPLEKMAGRRDVRAMDCTLGQDWP